VVRVKRSVFVSAVLAPVLFAPKPMRSATFFVSTTSVSPSHRVPIVIGKCSKPTAVLGLIAGARELCLERLSDRPLPTRFGRSYPVTRSAA
jgi:hypothetical protein